MEELGLAQRSDEIDDKLYRAYFKQYCLTRCLGGCCAKALRKVRMKQASNSLTKLVQIEQKLTPTKPSDIFQVLIAASEVLAGKSQILDFYADVIMLYVIYLASQRNDKEEFENDYQIAIAVCFISLAATFMAS